MCFKRINLSSLFSDRERPLVCLNLKKFTLTHSAAAREVEKISENDPQN